MEFGVLGPITVTTARGEVDIGGARQRRLLAVLLSHAGEIIPLDRLTNMVFEGDPPRSAGTTMRSYVARLRRALPAAGDQSREIIVTEQGGYGIRIDPAHLDSARFEASIPSARARLADRDAVGAAQLLRNGLELWRGVAYGEFAHEEWAQGETARLSELKTVAQEELHGCLLACGLASDVVSATRALVAEHPLRERLRAQHMLALYRSGRQLESLRSFDEYQAALVEVGLEPSSELRALGGSIAAHDPALRLDSPVGQPLRGYRIGTQIGQGAHGVVYRAVQPGVGREVAVKTIRAQLADDPAFIRGFDAEAQLVANLEHPHIVPIYDYWREPGGAYIVMRLLAGNLATSMAGGPLEVDTIGSIVRQLGGALATAHRARVVHGDIKPTNVLVDDGDVFLADFGVAALAESASGDRESSPSSGFESPEILAGLPASPMSDQFALAVLIFRMLTGMLPFGTRGVATMHDRSPSIHAMRPSVPVAVDDVLWRALDWHPEDRHPSVEVFVERFLAALERREAELPGTSREITNPYKGLEAFTETDQANFHGRQGVVDELLSYVARPGQTGRFVVAIGASGSGKSSSVRAGLIPRLRSGAVDGSERWLYATMVPGSDPFGALRQARRPIAAAGSFSQNDDALDVAFCTSESGETDQAVTPENPVRGLLSEALPDGQQLVLVIDQLEELFSLVPNEDVRRSFIDGVADVVADDRCRVRVVATMRADFLDRPLRYAEFGRLVKGGAVTMVSMSASEMVDAITQPAVAAGVEVEPALVTELVADVIDQPAALPLLQFTLTELFNRGTADGRRMMTLRHYRDLGGVEAAVARRAEQVIAEVPQANRDLVRSVFLRLVTIDETNTVSRRRARRSQLLALATRPAEVETWLTTFGDARLLTFDHDADTREPTVEVAHEALITHWPRFDQWVRSAGDGLRIRQQIAEAAASWDGQGRDDGDLLRGVRLDSALELSADRPEDLDPLEHEFVNASEQQQQAEAEAQRERLEEQRRHNRRLRQLLSGVGILLAIALVAGLFAVDQRNDARSAGGEAALAKLISDSAAVITDDPELAILLALEAHRRSPGPATEQAVLNALGRNDIGNRTSTFEPLEACFGTDVDPDALTERAVTDGKFISRDLVTGEVRDLGPAPFECGVWVVDPITGRSVISDASGEHMWVGTIDKPATKDVSDSADGTLFPLGVAGDRFLSTSDWESSSVHDLNTGELIAAPTGVREQYDFALHPSGDYVGWLGRALDGGGNVGRLHLIDARDGTELYVIDTERFIGGVAFDTETGEMVVAVEGVALRTYDQATGDILAETPLPGTSEVRSVKIRPDGAVVVASLGQIEVLDRHTGPIREPVELRDAEHVMVRPDGTVLVFRSDDRLDVVDVNSDSLIDRKWPIADQARVSIHAGRAGVYDVFGLGAPEVIDLATGEREAITSTSADPDSPIVWVYPEEEGAWTIFADGTMTLRRGDEIVHRLTLDTPINTGTRYGDLLGLVSARGGEAELALIDLSPEAPRVIFKVPATDVSTAHPSADGGLHALGLDGTLRTYDAAGELISEFDTGATAVTILTLDPVSARLAVGTGGGVALIDTETGAVEHLEGGEYVTNLGFARDGSMLVITGADGTVRLWDLDRNAPAGLVWDGTGSVFASPSWYNPETDSVWVSTSGFLMEVPLDPQRWVQKACALVGRELTESEWERWIPGNDALQSACI